MNSYICFATYILLRRNNNKTDFLKPSSTLFPFPIPHPHYIFYIILPLYIVSFFLSFESIKKKKIKCDFKPKIILIFILSFFYIFFSFFLSFCSVIVLKYLRIGTLYNLYKYKSIFLRWIIIIIIKRLWAVLKLCLTVLSCFYKTAYLYKCYTFSVLSTLKMCLFWWFYLRECCWVSISRWNF